MLRSFLGHYRESNKPLMVTSKIHMSSNFYFSDILRNFPSNFQVVAVPKVSLKYCKDFLVSTKTRSRRPRTDDASHHTHRSSAFWYSEPDRTRIIPIREYLWLALGEGRLRRRWGPCVRPCVSVFVTQIFCAAFCGFGPLGRVGTAHNWHL